MESKDTAFAVPETALKELDYHIGLLQGCRLTASRMVETYRSIWFNKPTEWRDTKEAEQMRCWLMDMDNYFDDIEHCISDCKRLMQGQVPEDGEEDWELEIEEEA